MQNLLTSDEEQPAPVSMEREVGDTVKSVHPHRQQPRL